ncbi:MAG: MFS transporter, partial [Planctomycetaceae bacterium]
SLANWSHRFGTPFLAIAALGAVVWCVAQIHLPSLPGASKANQVVPLKMFTDVVRQANHLWSFAFMLAMIFGTFMIVPYIAPYLEANCGLARKHLPVIYAVAGACSLLVMNLSGWLSDRFGPRKVFIASASGAVVMTLIITNLPAVHLAVAVLVTSLFMSFASSRMVPAQAMMLRSADPKARGAFTSLNTAVSHFATGVGPLISGAIVDEAYPGGPLTHYGLAGAVAAFFGVTAIGLSFLLRTANTTQPRANVASTQP